MNGDDVLQAQAADSPEDLARILRSLRRRHARRRADTELTYRELSAKSGYAHGVIGDYFSGKILPPTDRLDVLAGLLGATGAELSALATLRDRIEERRRRGSRSRSEGAGAAWRSLPRDIGLFTGRVRELRLLGNEAIAQGAVAVCAIGGMAGVGKTALAVHTAHMLADRFPDGQVFLSLHGHTLGRLPADPADVLADLLRMCGVPAQRVPKGLEGRASLWRTRIAGQRLLLVLDDAANHDQVRPLLPGTAGSLVLITSRRRLTALEGVRAISLDVLSPGEAADLLARHADRDGLRAGDYAAEEICRLCGFLPLALGMLGRQLHHHPTWTAEGLAAELAAAQSRLELIRAEDLSVAASFDLSYRDLAEAEQRLFRHLGLHPGNDFDAYAAAALNGTTLNLATRGLEALYDRYLVEETTRGRYRFHDLIDEHSRTLAADPAVERDKAMTRILDYYASAACAASQHLARRAPVAATAPPAAMPSLRDRDEAALWMKAEFANLCHVARHAVAIDRPGHVITLAWALNGYMLTEGHWHEALALHRLAIEAARQMNDPIAEAGALTRLAVVQRLTGQPGAAVSSLQRALAHFRDHSDLTGQAHALNELGVTQYILCDYPSAADSITRALELCRSRGDAMAESGALNDLGLVQQAAGQYATAADTFTRALQMHRELGDQLWEANALNNIGVVQRHAGDLGAALASHQHALEIYRALGNPFGEARALTDIGAVQLLTGDGTAASSSHRAALQLYQKIGNQAGTADALNNLGEVALAEGRPEQAAPCHRRALAIAESIASPAEQARALEGIGHCELRYQHHAAGFARLDQALAIYRQIGAPDADRVAAELKRLKSERPRSSSPDAPPTPSRRRRAGPGFP